MTADDIESKHVAVETIADGGREWEEGQEEKEKRGDQVGAGTRMLSVMKTKYKQERGHSFFLEHTIHSFRRHRATPKHSLQKSSKRRCLGHPREYEVRLGCL